MNACYWALILARACAIRPKRKSSMSKESKKRNALTIGRPLSSALAGWASTLAKHRSEALLDNALDPPIESHRVSLR